MSISRQSGVLRAKRSSKGGRRVFDACIFRPSFVASHSFRARPKFKDLAQRKPEITFLAVDVDRSQVLPALK